MLLLTDFLAKFLLTMVACAAALWCAVALETYRVHRLVRATRELKRRCRRLLSSLRSVRADRDRWRGEALRWQAAYWRAVDHEGDGAHATAPQPTLLTLVHSLEEDDAPVP